MNGIANLCGFEKRAQINSLLIIPLILRIVASHWTEYKISLASINRKFSFLSSELKSIKFKFSKIPHTMCKIPQAQLNPIGASNKAHLNFSTYVNQFVAHKITF